MELETGRPEEQGALAVTDASRIAIARDAPTGLAGRRLLAHELAHVIQQSAPAERLSAGGEPVTFDGEFYHVSGLDPADAPAPRIFTGSVGPKSLAVTGRLAAVTRRIIAHVARGWPRLGEPAVRHRGQFCYVAA